MDSIIMGKVMTARATQYACMTRDKTQLNLHALK